MAVKAVCLVQGVKAGTGATFDVDISFTAVPWSAGLAGILTESGFTVGLLPTAIEAQVTGAVKNYLVGQGVTFGLLDTVRMVGALL